MTVAGIETYYSFPNINEENNSLRYSSDNGASWKRIEIPKGSYGMGGIQNEVKRVLRENDDYHEVNKNICYKFTCKQKYDTSSFTNSSELCSKF